MYYGNGGSSATRVDDPKGTYDVNAVVVFHFAEINAPAHDSTTYGNNAQNPGASVSGALIGPGVRFDGSNPITIRQFGIARLDGGRGADVVGVGQAGGQSIERHSLSP